MTHPRYKDWPRNVAKHGDLQGLLRRKAFLRGEIEDGSFGSPPAEYLMGVLKPTYWFSAHMHTKYPAVVRHCTPAGGDLYTRFLALDKCLPRRDFLQVSTLPVSACSHESARQSLSSFLLQLTLL